jgi:hypothetical protein
MDLAKSLRENGFSGGDASLVLVNKLVRVLSSSTSIGGIQSPAVGRKGEPKRSAVHILPLHSPTRDSRASLIRCRSRSVAETPVRR